MRQKRLHGIAVALLCAAAIFLSLWPGRAAAQEVDSAAASAIVMEAQNGTVLLYHDAETERPMASTTKIMTGMSSPCRLEVFLMIRPMPASMAFMGVTGVCSMRR